MSDKIDRVLEKLDTLDGRVDNIDVTMAKQSVILDEHVRRTNILEEELRPIKKHVGMVNAIVKILIGVGGLVGFLATLKALLE